MNVITFRPATLADSQRIASLHTVSWRDAYRGILPDAYLEGPIFLHSVMSGVIYKFY